MTKNVDATVTGDTTGADEELQASVVEESEATTEETTVVAEETEAIEMEAKTDELVTSDTIDDASAEATPSDTVTESEQTTEEAVIEAPEGELDAAATDDGTEVTNEVAEDSAQESVTEDTDATDSEPVGEDDDKRVVRMLAVGQQVDGVVKRITEFGAFIDIGVGRDGLIHVSELSLQRVAKVGDVLSQKQEIKPWIKKLDRKRNRISLTLIDPEMKTIKDLKSDEIVTGTVARILPYGAFIDIGIGRDALLHVREMSNKYVEKPEDIVQVGETIEARIIELSKRRGRVDLSLKGLRDEPEEETEVEEVTADAEIEEEVDEFEDAELLSMMELAFKKAVETDGDEIQVEKKSGNKDRRWDSRAMQDEIIARTLDTARK